MLLTVYFMAATWIQSWKLRTIYAKLSQYMTQNASVVFYRVQNEGIATVMPPASSELCINYAQARIADIIWHADGQRGAALIPKQHVYLSPWISFPVPPSLVPFEMTPNTGDFKLNEGEPVFILLETDLQPSIDDSSANVLMIEHFGRPLAWKVDSRFAVLLHSDLEHFTELVMRSFMQSNLTINDNLPLTRIQSVSIEGDPQPFDSIKNHSRKDIVNRAMRRLTPEQWNKYVAGLCNLNILASQASEYEYNKNRTEGKTGIVKPDLIPSKSDATPRRLASDGASAGTSVMRKPSPKPSPRTSPLKLIPEVSLEKTESPPPPQLASTELELETVSTTAVPVDLTPDVAATNDVEARPASPAKSATTDLLNAERLNVSVPITLSTDKPIETDGVASPVAVSDTKPANRVVSSRHNGAARPTLVRSKGSLLACKPPNVLVYSDSLATRDSVIATLATILEVDMYTVYPLTPQQVKTKIWIDNTTLLVVCGYVAADIGEILTEYFLRGGKMLSLCSDVLHIVLPSFRTHAEVREHELVQFSYGRWQRVRMMHHIFCYQPSPVRKHFSTDSDEPQPSRKPTMVCPRSVEVQDLQHNVHNLQVQVLGTEETWNTPSLILATNASTGGKAVFSQVHLETDPNAYENDEAKFAVLKQMDSVRIEIFMDLLSSHLGIVVASIGNRNVTKAFSNAFFLGDHKFKYDLLERLKPNMTEPNTLRTVNLTMRFCGHREQPPKASAQLLPILINSCPENFSTVDYFDNLKSEKIGRLAIYVPVMTSTMHVMGNLVLGHGLAVIARHQTAGTGRNKNQWLSPDGCVMFSLQLHIPLASPLGQRLPLLQHMMATAMVNAVLSIKGYEELNIGLKWPNDIYANGRTKIGGLITTSQIDAAQAICNVGCGINLSNSSPTVCINDLIKEYNVKNNTALADIKYEQLLALTFTELERIFKIMQGGDLNYFYDLYDKLWLHSDAEVTIIDSSGGQKVSKIIGIDDYGFLLVQRSGEAAETVHPDGNSFDMLRGLIVPK